MGQHKRVRCPKCHHIFSRARVFNKHKLLTSGQRNYCGVDPDAQPLPVVEDLPQLMVGYKPETTPDRRIIPVGSAEEIAYVIEHREDLVTKILAVRGGYQMLPAQYAKIVWCNPDHVPTGNVAMLNARKGTILVKFPEGCEVIETYPEVSGLVQLAHRQVTKVLAGVLHTANSDELNARLADYVRWLEYGNHGAPRLVLEDNHVKLLNTLTVDHPEFRAQKRQALMRQT